MEISFPSRGNSKYKGPEVRTRVQCSEMSRETSAADYRHEGKQEAIRMGRQVKDRWGRILQMGKIF